MMKNPFKHERTTQETLSQEQESPMPLAISDLTDADLEQVQGGKGSTSPLLRACCNGKHLAQAPITVR